MRSLPRSNQGMTLLEVLVAMALTAVIGMIAFAAIRSASEQSVQVRAHDQALGDLESAVHWLVSDLRRAVPRSIRLPDGSTEAALDSEQGNALDLTVRGVADPDSTALPALYRVRYELQGTNLVRLRWDQLEHGETAVPLQTVVLTDVHAFSVRFLDKGLARSSAPLEQWMQRWPEGPGMLDSLPLAVSIGIEGEAFGKINRIVELPADGR